MYFNGIVFRAIEKEAREQGARGMVQMSIQPHLLRQLPIGYENHLIEVEDVRTVPLRFTARCWGHFPPLTAPCLFVERVKTVHQTTIIYWVQQSGKNFQIFQRKRLFQKLKN
jgi:hypothetical protein